MKGKRESWVRVCAAVDSGIGAVTSTMAYVMTCRVLTLWVCSSAHLMVFVLVGRSVRRTIDKDRSHRWGLRPSGRQLVRL